MILTRLLSRLSQPTTTGHDVEYQNILPVFEPEGRMSKNIFQVCLRNGSRSETGTSDTMPDNFRQAILKLRNQNPEWDYHLVDERSAIKFILDNYGKRVLEYYNRIDARYGAVRADFLRYLLLYKWGGVYIDLKCGLEHALDNSIIEPDKFHVFFWDCFERGNHHFAISQNIPEGEMLQGFIVSPAGHPFLREVIVRVMKNIDRYNPYIHGVGFGGVVSLAGPAVYTEVLYKCYKMHPECCTVARPFADFGFILYAVDGNGYITGEYQKKIGLTDYRKLSLPIVVNCNKLVNAFNCLYLKLLNAVRNGQ